MALFRFLIVFIFSTLLTQVAFAEPIYASLEALTTPTIHEGNEGDRRTVVVQVRLSTAPEEVVQVRVKSLDHDALAGVDYYEFDETLVFSPGETLQAFVIQTIPNNIDNPYRRKFMLKLSDPVGVKLGEPTLIITILDDDEVLTMDSTFFILEKDKGEDSYIDVVVKREFDNEEEGVVFDLKTKDGTAHAGVDYEAENFEGILLPGELQKTFRFTVIGDDKFEEYEYFYAELVPRSETTRTTNSPVPLYIQDNDGSFYFTYDLDVTATARSQDAAEAVRGQTAGEIPLKRFVDGEGKISYEGEAVLTHTNHWGRFGNLPTQPSRTKVKFYGINNKLDPENTRVEWSVGPDEHLRCLMPPPMGFPMNCIWWASMVNYHLNKNWTPAGAGKWGTFLLKGFEQFNETENKAHVVAVKKDVLNYTLVPSPEGMMEVRERGTYKIIRKAR